MRAPVIAFLLATASCAPGASTAPEGSSAAAPAYDEGAVKGEVEALIREWSAAGTEGRWGDLKTLYADDPDFFWVEQGGLAYADYASVVAGLDQVAATNATVRNDVADIIVTPLSADAVTFRATANISLASADFSFDFNGVFTGVAVIKDGRWRFLNGHLSKPVATP